ncbi:MAG TPA: hypothetical protein VG650_07765 [Mycobacteriales bacterium]|nr:hypothetical protein [Mycobacteriales bacterium]
MTAAAMLCPAVAAVPSLAASVVPASGPQTSWTAVSGAGASIPTPNDPAVYRYGHHTLEVAWMQRGTTNGDVLMTRRFDSRTGAKKGGTHKVMPAWAAINSQPRLVSYQGQRVLVFAGIRNPLNNLDPYNASEAYYFTSTDGKAWVLQPNALSHTAGVAASAGLAATSAGGQLVVAYALSPNGWITYHQGITGGIPAGGTDETTDHDTKCCVYDPALASDPSGGRVWAAWYSNSPNQGWNGIDAQPVPTGTRYSAPGSSSTSGAGAVSVSPGQAVQLAARPASHNGGVYTAYAIGYPTPTTIGVWKLGTGKTALRIDAGHLVADVGIAAGLGGRLWVYWADRATHDIRVALTNTKVTKVAATYTLRPPNSTYYQALTLVGDGSDSAKGRLNLVAVIGGTRTAIFYTQVKP